MPGAEKRRVVVTGMGVLSALGSNREEFRESLAAGRCGVSKFTRPDDFWICAFSTARRSAISVLKRIFRRKTRI